MKNTEMSSDVERMISLIRGRRVMLSMNLARLYEVTPAALLQAVKRNRERFPEDFMFQLSREECLNLKSQIVISSWGGRRANPYAFTEQGVAMLSSVSFVIAGKHQGWIKAFTGANGTKERVQSYTLERARG